MALVTFTVIVQEPFAGTMPPVSTRLVPLLAPVTEPDVHVVAADAEAEFARPAGYVSVNAAPVTPHRVRVGERDGEDARVTPNRSSPA